MENETHIITFETPKDDNFIAMRRWCDENERSVSWFMRKAVDCYLAHLGIK